MAQTDKQKAVAMAAIDLKLTELNKAINTIQGNVHDVMIMTCIYAWQNNDADIVSKVLNNLTGVKGSFRVESVAYWFKQIAGMNCTFNEKLDKYTTKFCKAGEYASSHGVIFSFDKAHLAVLKLDKNRFWKIAPITIKELKLQDDIAKVTGNAEIQLARSFAAGHIDQAALSLHIAGMVARITNLANTGKTKEWLEEFYTQHPEQKPAVTLDLVEAELAALAKAELEAELEELEA
jgi:hypothetical protein